MASTYFISGTMHIVEYPDGADIDLSEVYDAYFNDEELPEGVEVIESEVNSYWEGDTV